LKWVHGTNVAASTHVMRRFKASGIQSFCCMLGCSMHVHADDMSLIGCFRLILGQRFWILHLCHTTLQ
jgi:hypothetical protein